MKTKLKRSLRLTAALLGLAVIAGTLGLAGAAEEVATAPDALRRSYVAGTPTELITSVGLQTSWMSNHGHGQTRMAQTSRGTYYGLFTSSDPNADPQSISLIFIDHDNNVSVLYQDFIDWRASGPTVVVMVDKEENVWMYAGWDVQVNDHFFLFSLWRCDAETHAVTNYRTCSPYSMAANRGSGAGYSVAALDADRGIVFAACNSGDKPGYMEWNTFSLETLEWGEMRGVELDYRYCYNYIMPDGEGGFHVFGLRDVLAASIKSNLGISVEKAARDYHARWLTHSMIFDEWDYFHVADPTKAEVTLQTAVEPATYDVLNGMFPDSHMAEVYKDNDGLLHFLFSSMENYDVDGNMRPGYRTLHVVWNTVGGTFTEITRDEIDFLNGSNHQYLCRMYQDTTGRFYVIAMKSDVYGARLEIWTADTPTGDLYLAWAEDLGSGFHPAGCAVANSRNNSLMGDVCHFSFYDDIRLEWYKTQIDLAALRGLVEK